VSSLEVVLVLVVPEMYVAGWADSSPQRGPVLPAVRHAHVRLVSKDLHLLVEVDLR